MTREPVKNTIKTMKTIASRNFLLLTLLSVAWLLPPQNAGAQTAQAPYPSMAPLEQYLMPDRDAEIALARTAAPKSISDDATIVVLDRQHGYVTAVNGKNGFVCIVERAWTSPFDDPGFWNPKNRSPICYNRAAAQSVLPYTFKRTEMVLAG